jgi:tRNA (guanine10-N2)-dimethyltransferase
LAELHDSIGSLGQPLERPEQRSTLFFVLSGEHHSLPAAEIKAIIASEGLEYSSQSSSYRFLTLTAPQKALKFVSERSLMYDWCGILLGACEAQPNEIDRFIKNQPLEAVSKSAQNFVVRSVRIGGVSKSIVRDNLERDIGALVKDSVPRLSVKLKDPDLTFVCILNGSKFLFGMSAFKKPSGLMAPRRPRKRPAFHPSTMPPKIARCMVNLARAKPGSTFLDPFCGVGGILIEAAVVGCRVVGIDASSRMLRGARRNLKHFNLDPLGFVHGDARTPPIGGGGGLDAIATDPPYGRGSSTMGVKMSALIQDFLSRAASLLSKDGHLCISAPVEVDTVQYAQDGGLNVEEEHLVRVHRSLTRRFMVLRRK